ncbi:MULTISPECIES: hypothetical protein [Streptomyces]|jgi:hypothetical protein|uniref:Uncharacterized protein n=1 Tax=Streptomyces sp. 900129855 TaxID=3155129 RepID=A0ABV2ZZK4_9ACTN
MPPTSTSLTPHRAGRDEQLRLALEDLQLGRWLSTKELLDHTLWASRTSRTQVLAVAAAQSDAVDAWYAEDPGDANAAMMRARVLTQRALVTHRAGAAGDVLRRIRMARGACDEAAVRWPADPVPWVDQLALAQLDLDIRAAHRPEHWAAPPETMLPRGPWPLLWEVSRRDPANREAYHRMLQCLQARGDGAVDFTRWVASRVKPGSVLLTLPLYAYVDEFRQRNAGGQISAGIGFWQNEMIQYYVGLARNSWFAYLTHPGEASLLDLNYLAYTLTASGMAGAHWVFEAIGSFATPAPWRYVSKAGRYWEDDFLQARAYAYRRRSART